ncbi:MAG: hypothetical protein KC668_24195 [Myxococcales bacterium]|nr:hypothetical protein [Myxococcales bacterium]
MSRTPDLLRTRGALLILLLAVALHAVGLEPWLSVAHAQVTDDERAHSHFLAGSSYYDQRRYVEAAEQFQEAFNLSGRVTLLLNVATSYKRAGRPGDAADAVARWLELAPEDASDRRTQTNRLEQLRAQQAEIDARGATTAEPTVSPSSPDDGGAEAAAGLGTLGTTGVVLLGAGAAVGVVSLATGLAASARQDELERGCTDERVCPSSLSSTRRRGRALSRASTATTFLSIATLGAGAALLLVDLLGDDDTEQAGTARVLRPAAGPGDVGVGMSLTF